MESTTVTVRVNQAFPVYLSPEGEFAIPIPDQVIAFRISDYRVLRCSEPLLYLNVSIDRHGVALRDEYNPTERIELPHGSDLLLFRNSAVSLAIAFWVWLYTTPVLPVESRE